MDGSLTALRGAQERFTEVFTALVEWFNSDRSQPFRQHVSSLDNAQKEYLNALRGVLSAFKHASGPILNRVPGYLLNVGINKLEDELLAFFTFSCILPDHIRFDESSTVSMLLSLERTIPNLIAAAQDCKEAVTYVVTGFNAASGRHTDNSVVECISTMHDRFLQACNNLREIIEMKSRHYFNIRSQPGRDLEGASHTSSVDPNATEAAPVSQDNTQPRLALPSEGQGDMESDTPHEKVADMSEECGMAVSQALPDFNLNNTEPEETVEHKIVAAQVLPEPDP